MFAEWGIVTDDNVEAVVEVLAKFAGLDGLLEIFIGGGEDAGFELYGVSASDALELLLLEGSEQLCLHGRGEFADLVEEQRSVFGCFKLAFSHSDGAGVCTFLMTEEFTFEERLGDCGAVDGDEWAILSRAGLVDGACDDFFASAAFAADEDGRVAL